MQFGAGRGQTGLVMMITLGTGIGTAMFMNGHLVPNSELGHLIIRGKDAELRASDRARSSRGWRWKKWAKRLDEYLRYVEALLHPDLFILGGGVSKKHERFLGYLTTTAPVVPAEMRNEAGIVGAALAAGSDDL
jgi:polyphosphate glucokinase